MRDDWRKFVPGIEAAYLPWMHDHGSLTRRIRQRCAIFQVNNMYTRACPIQP